MESITREASLKSPGAILAMPLGRGWVDQWEAVAALLSSLTQWPVPRPPLPSGLCSSSSVWNVSDLRQNVNFHPKMLSKLIKDRRKPSLTFRDESEWGRKACKSLLSNPKLPNVNLVLVTRWVLYKCVCITYLFWACHIWILFTWISLVSPSAGTCVKQAHIGHGTSLLSSRHAITTIACLSHYISETSTCNIFE